MSLIFLLVILVFQTTFSSAVSFTARENESFCDGLQEGSTSQEGCLVRTCNKGEVTHTLANECREIIQKMVKDLVEEKLAEAGISTSLSAKDSSRLVHCPSNPEIASNKTVNQPGANSTTSITPPDSSIKATTPAESDFLFLGDKLFELPHFKPISHCPISKHPVQSRKYPVTGLVDGKIMTCGGKENKNQDRHDPQKVFCISKYNRRRKYDGIRRMG